MIGFVFGLILGGFGGFILTLLITSHSFDMSDE